MPVAVAVLLRNKLPALMSLKSKRNKIRHDEGQPYSANLYGSAQDVYVGFEFSKTVAMPYPRISQNLTESVETKTATLVRHIVSRANLRWVLQFLTGEVSPYFVMPKSGHL